MNNGVSLSLELLSLIYSLQVACSECDFILAEQNCIQFYVKSSKGIYILHEDEIDITGMCAEQTHCSGKFGHNCTAVRVRIIPAVNYRWNSKYWFNCFNLVQRRFNDKCDKHLNCNNIVNKVLLHFKIATLTTILLRLDVFSTKSRFSWKRAASVWSILMATPKRGQLSGGECRRFLSLVLLLLVHELINGYFKNICLPCRLLAMFRIYLFDHFVFDLLVEESKSCAQVHTVGMTD